MNNHEQFFQKEAPEIVAKLSNDSPRKFGTMSPAQMVEHITAGAKLMLVKKEVPLTIPEEMVPKAQAFLMSDKPIRPGAPKPQQYSMFEKGENKELETLKKEFVSALQNFDKVTQTDEDFWCCHPNFGKINAEQTRQLQYKHLMHHFGQFGLV